MDALVKKVLMLISTEPYPPSLVVFVGDMTLVATVYSALVPNLPVYFSTPIHIQHIDRNTKFLKGHKFCVSVFHDSCFRYVSPEEFLNTHYDWLEKQIDRLYEKQPGIEEFFDREDLFQEVCLRYLDKILSKYDGQCNLRSFVANRLRRYVDYIIREQLTIKRDEILGQLRMIQE